MRRFYSTCPVRSRARAVQRAAIKNARSILSFSLRGELPLLSLEVWDDLQAERYSRDHSEHDGRDSVLLVKLGKIKT